MSQEIYETLNRLIDEGKKQKVADALVEGVLEEIPEDTVAEVCRRIAAFRNPVLMKLLARNLKTFSLEMLKDDEGNYPDAPFMREILDNYYDKFNRKDEAVAEELFSIAINCGHAKTIERLIKSDRGSGAYHLLGSAPDNVFPLVKYIDPDTISDEEYVLLVTETALSPCGELRLKKLLEYGFNLIFDDDEGNPVYARIQRCIDETEYPKTREGENLKNGNLRALEFIKNLEGSGMADYVKQKKRRRAVVAVVIAGLCILAVLIGFATGKATASCVGTAVDTDATSEETTTASQ